YTSPLKLFEYMAVGKPIVASDLPSVRDVIEPDRDGLLVPANDPKGFSAAIDRLLMQPDLRNRLSGAARERARNYTWEARARRIIDFLLVSVRVPSPDRRV